MTTLEAIELVKSKSPHELTPDELAALREVFEESPALYAALGGREEVEAYLASAEEALASGTSAADAAQESQSELESEEEDVPEAAHSGLGKHAVELLLAVALVAAVGWWLATRFLAIKEEQTPTAQRAAEDEGKVEDEDAASDHGDRKAGASGSKKAKRKVRRKGSRPKRPWEAWKIARGESTKIRVDDDWDVSDPSTPRRLRVLRTQGGPITLSRTREFLPQHRWLLVDVRPEQFMTTPGTISVRIDGKEAAVIAIGGCTTLLPLYIEVAPGEPREVALSIEFTPGESGQRIAWWTVKPVAKQEMEPRPASPLVTKLLSDDPSVRRQAAIEAARTSDGFTRAILAHAINDEDPSVRKEVARSIFKRNDLAGNEALCNAMATHEDCGVRPQFAEHLVKNPDPRAEEALIKALATADEKLAVTAIAALSKLESERADAAIARLVRHPDVKIALTAAETIWHRNNDAVEAAMLSALKDHPVPAVQQLAARRYESLPSPNAVDALRAAMASEGNALRRQAANSLGRIKGPKSSAALIGALKSYHVARVVHMRRDGATEAAMIAAINSHVDIRVRRMAAKRFELLPSPNAVDALRRAQASEDDELRKQAARSLDMIKKADPGPPPKKSLAKGQFVRVRLKGERTSLCLAEVQVHQTGDGAELHRAGKAMQSSSLMRWGADRAIDGNLAQYLNAGGVSHTNEQDDPFWLLDLGGVRDIGRIKIFSRDDGGTRKEQLKGAIVEILDPARKVVYTAKVINAKNGAVHEFVAK